MRDDHGKSATDGVLLAIDQGTSSSRAIAFSPDGSLVATEQQAFEQLYPASGWVEHVAEVIWATVLSTTRAVIERRRAHSQRDRLAGPAHRRALPPARGTGSRGRSRREDRPETRSLLLGDEAR